MEKGFVVFTNKIIFLKLDGSCFPKESFRFYEENLMNNVDNVDGINRT